MKNNSGSEKCHCCNPFDILESIALEEAAISHILNAEGEKIQKAVASNASIKDLLCINSSVSSTISDVVSLEIVLLEKLKKAMAACENPCLFCENCFNDCCPNCCMDCECNSDCFLAENFIEHKNCCCKCEKDLVCDKKIHNKNNSFENNCMSNKCLNKENKNNYETEYECKEKNKKDLIDKPDSKNSTNNQNNFAQRTFTPFFGNMFFRQNKQNQQQPDKKN